MVNALMNVPSMTPGAIISGVIGKVIAGCGKRVRDRATDGVRAHDDVRVGKHENVARRGRCPALERVVLAEPAGGQPVDAHHAQPRIARLHTRKNGRRGVAGAIVDDRQFEVGIVLREQGLERCFEVRFFVARGDDNGYPRRR